MQPRVKAPTSPAKQGERVGRHRSPAKQGEGEAVRRIMRSTFNHKQFSTSTPCRYPLAPLVLLAATASATYLQSEFDNLGVDIDGSSAADLVAEIKGQHA